LVALYERHHFDEHDERPFAGGPLITTRMVPPMKPVILGLSAFYHDSAAALSNDGVTSFALQEERVSRIKFDSAFPSNAIGLALAHAGLKVGDLDSIAFFEDPSAKLDRILSTTSKSQILHSLSESWDQKFHVDELIRQRTGFRGPIQHFDHHESHAAYAFFSTELERALVVVADGVGEWDTASVWLGEGARLERLSTTRFPHSLGLFYAAITAFIGFRPNADEYKVMGLASFGVPRFTERLRQMLFVSTDGFECDPRYFNFETVMYSERLSELLGVPPRAAEASALGVYADIAASAQEIVQECLINLIQCGSAKINDAKPIVCFGGGVALNCVAAGRIRDTGLVKDVLVPPGADDAGSAIGAAMLAFVRQTGRRPAPIISPYLGPEFTDEESSKFLSLIGMQYEALDEIALIERVSSAIARGAVIGWFQGRAEFGPRALGNRSILADPRSASMKDLINEKVKHREGFRPFAPICLESAAGKWFDPGTPSPYMTSVFRSLCPESLAAVTHVDGTARLQTIPSDPPTRTVRLIEAFAAKTGIPVLLNTSFNVAEEPIVSTPFDAFNTFRESKLDILVLGNCVVHRDQQDELVMQPGTHRYMTMARPLAPLSNSTYFFS
jgi:carbamoyltransferase